MDDDNKYFYINTEANTIFGANEHIVVDFYHFRSKTENYVFLRRWTYPTFITTWLANVLAERKVAWLQAYYKATPLYINR